MSVATLDNEKKRLKVLWQYEVLDTVPEAIFDDLTELAAGICEAPIALISLVDEKRQWFKSKFGTNLTETSRDVSFCSHAIRQPDLFIVSDTTLDARFATNPLVTSDPKIRFYAGAPLVTADGYALGTLCVIDKVPRQLSAEQKQNMRVLARHVVSQLELRRRSLEARQSNVADGSSSAQREIARLKTELADAQKKLARSATAKPRRPKPKTKLVRSRRSSRR